MSDKPPWWTREHAELLRYIIECTPPDQPVDLTQLTGCEDMATNDEKQVIGAFTALSEQISDLKATMEAKFDAQQRQLSRLEERDDRIAEELANIKGTVFHSHDKAIAELESDGKEYVTRREFNGGLNRIRTTVESFKWALGLILLLVTAVSVPLFLRFFGVA